MGRYCGDLAVYASLASGADLVVRRENPMTEEEILEEVRKQKNMGKHHIIVLITEKILNVHQLADKITVQCGIEAKSEVLGRIQRGGTPVALDRYLASTMGVYAVDTLLAGKTGVCVGIINNELTATPIEEALKMTNKSNKEIKTKSYFDNRTKKSDKMKFPLNNLDDCNYWHYTLQLSTYAWMIQKLNPEFEIEDLVLVHFDHNDNMTVYHLPYLKEEVVKMLNHFKKESSLKASREKRKPIIY
jgi:hypothetical protein